MRRRRYKLAFHVMPILSRPADSMRHVGIKPGGVKRLLGMCFELRISSQYFPMQRFCAAFAARRQ
jgi:hypothetical protein